MQGDTKVIAYLNEQLTNELTAINQYFLHSRMYAHWGYAKLAAHEYEESIDEMKHADLLINRILFLGGLPNLQRLNKLLVAQKPIEAIECDLKLEQGAVKTLREAIAHCEQVADYTSRDLFADILSSEEDHIDWLETQLDLVKSLGEERYLQTQVHE